MKTLDIPTKPFPLRDLLTVTTGRLLTKPTHDGNGIGALYELLGWMTDDSPMTHQLGRFSEECKPWLLKWFPMLAPAEVALPLLDASIKHNGRAGVELWLAELPAIIPGIKDNYDVPRIPSGDHVQKDAISELIDMRGGSSKGIHLVSAP